MNIYSIKRVKGGGYDVYEEHIIVASSENEVRDLAATKTGDEGPATWLNTKKSLITLMGTFTGTYNTKPHIVCSEGNFV